jgi:hypothetical protein
MKPEHFQGFWKALSERDGAIEKFANLLALCEEFSVKLDYSTPVSGGEWIVNVAHFGDRTEFRFPRLNFNARDAYNTISQRLIKAKTKLEAEQEKEAPKSVPTTSDEPSTSEPAQDGPVDMGDAHDTAKTPTDQGKSLEDSTQESENQSSSNGETVSETTTEPENGAEKSAKKKEKK